MYTGVRVLRVIAKFFKVAVSIIIKFMTDYMKSKISKYL